MLMNNPEIQQSSLTKMDDYALPLHRIRSIMKQDTYYAPKTEAVAAMSKATEHFAYLLLQEVKQITEGKHRIIANDLYDCISNNFII